MTEKEKMLSGELFLPGDQDLKRERNNAKKHIFRINNNTDPILLANEFSILLPHMETTAHIEPPFYCDFGYNIEIGEWTFINHNVTILDEGIVNIGLEVNIGPNVGIYTVKHPYNKFDRAAGYEQAAPVIIGDYVWIGGGAQILPGVIIGENSIIGAGSVVTHSIPSGVIAAGNPCQVIRFLTEDELKEKPAE